MIFSYNLILDTYNSLPPLADASDGSKPFFVDSRGHRLPMFGTLHTDKSDIDGFSRRMGDAIAHYRLFSITAMHNLFISLKHIMCHETNKDLHNG